MGIVEYHSRQRDMEQPCVRAIRDVLSGGNTVYIVGKGPSLDALVPGDFAEFPGAPVLCINESIHAIEKLDIPSNRLFCIQHDKLNDVINRPSRATWILSSFAWDVQQGDAAGAVKFEREAVSLSRPNLTASTAISMAALAGANQAVMMAFDAKFSCNCDYAGSIGHTPEVETLKSDRFIQFADQSLPVRASEEGVRLIWQAPKDFWLIALVLRSGGSYAMQHVDAIREQLARHLKTPHDILLFTDKYDVPCSKKVMLSTDWPGWFAKIEMFRPDVCFRGGVLFTDLDNYFGRDFTLPGWESMEPGRIYMPRDPYRDLWASGLMSWRLGTVTEPYEQFVQRPVTRHPADKVFGDQEIINTIMQGRMLESSWLTTASWKKDKPRTDAVDCVLFHGSPKPWDVGLVQFARKSDGPLVVVKETARNASDRKTKTFLDLHPQFACMRGVRRHSQYRIGAV